MIKPIAIHLPQFHPIPENDLWWGKGFTEWTNVTKAKPLFESHYQPHLPTDLGFYDLRLEESRVAQAELAKQYGIYGFCFYHYWFNGRRLLNRPLDDMLKTKTPDFPFMLCWANENWTKRWDGEEHQVLMKQEYNTSDYENHFEFLCSTFFADSRYIKIKNSPVFVVYRASVIQNLEVFLKIGRDTATKHGFDGIHFLCMDPFIDKPAEEMGFDGAIHFQPDYRYFKRNYGSWKEQWLHRKKIKTSVKQLHHFELYDDYVDNILKHKKTLTNNLYPAVTPGWDNTARRKEGGIILHDSTPAKFKYWLSETIKRSNFSDGEDNFLFINAWNEWAEGNHLEPCRKWGRQYLESVKEVLDEVNK